MTPLLVVVTAILVAALVWSVYGGTPAAGRTIKMAASTGFILVALSAGAASTRYGRFVLAALILSWVGDLLLTFGPGAPFLAGIASFLGAHLAYGAGFAVRGIDAAWLVGAGIAVLVVAIFLWRWLGPHVTGRLRAPVLAYVVVISSVVAAAFGTTGAVPDVRIPVGVVAFYCSDVAVARNRFVAPGSINRAIGLPLYYAAQLLLALSTAGSS